MLKNIITFLGWVLSALLLCIGIAAWLQGKLQVMVAVVIIIWGILFLPPLFGKTRQQSWTWQFCLRTILFVMVPVLLSPFISTEELSTSMEDLDLFRSNPQPTVSKTASPTPQPTATSTLTELSASPLPILQPLNLQATQIYNVAEATSLMTDHSPVDIVADLKQMKVIPKGGTFRVLEIFKKNDIPWYQVAAFDDEKKPMGVGWINGATLVPSKLVTAQSTPTPTATPSILPTPAITVTPALPSPALSSPILVPTSAPPLIQPTPTPAPKVSFLPRPSSIKISPNPKPPQVSKPGLPKHEVVTEPIPEGGSRISIEVEDPTASPEQCFALVKKYLPQAKGKGQVIVYKPNSKSPWNGRFLAFCLNDLDQRGTRINDVYDW